MLVDLEKFDRFWIETRPDCFIIFGKTFEESSLPLEKFDTIELAKEYLNKIHSILTE